MSKAAANKTQQKQMANGCIGKHRYDSDAAATQKGQTTYKNGIAVLTKPARAKAVLPTCNHAAQIKALQAKNATAGREIEALKAAIIKHKRDKAALHRRYERTIEGRIVNLYHAARKRLAQRKTTL